MKWYTIDYFYLFLDYAIAMQQNNQDACFLITGKEGRGKSNTALICYEYICKKKVMQEKIEHIARRLSEFLYQISVLKREGCAVLDEGGELASVDYNKDQVKDTIIGFKIMRKKSLITFICFTNPARIATYFREDRIKGVIHCPKRGQALYFSKSKFAHVLALMEKKNTKNLDMLNNTDLASFGFNLPEYKGVLKQAYEDRKDENIDKVMQEISDKYNPAERPEDEEYISFHQATKVLNVGSKKLKEYITQKKLKSYVNAEKNRTYISQNSINELLDQSNQ